MSEPSKRTATIRTRRSVKGYIFLGIFVLANLFLAFACLKALARLISERTAESGHSLMATLVAWFVIVAILGIPVWLTRGRKQKVIIE